MPGLAVVAVGGNALIRDPAHQLIADQYEMASRFAADVAGMVRDGWKVVVTHGNGPQIGFVLRRSELAMQELRPVPMDYAGADIQGSLGWMFARALRNELRSRGMRGEPVALVTQVLVDQDDPAFARPSKPIGSSMDEARARELAGRYGWTIREDAAGGWRRVVASPHPRAIIEAGAIRQLLDTGFVVVACGGGGIPVIEDAAGRLQGVEAVIDKDFASALLARELRAQALVILTGVEKVALDFRRPTQRWIDRMTVAQARRHDAKGQFDKGSMGPKVESLIEFIEGGGSLGLITDAPNLARALRGETGTRVVGN
ncbi:carbamate kinase [Caenimonas sp. DR4.4]|uniref:Carbamate kinase n=2 Tax=Caenimonas aquaedulcis TaxID=2793270 RepID=A0A931MIP2_9BURK|nr:carbamate kinase [Caenimonas aquaedulcis]